MSRPLKRQRAIYALADDQALIREQASKHGKTISGYPTLPSTTIPTSILCISRPTSSGRSSKASASSTS